MHKRKKKGMDEEEWTERMKERKEERRKNEKGNTFDYSSFTGA